MFARKIALFILNKLLLRSIYVILLFSIKLLQNIQNPYYESEILFWEKFIIFIFFDIDNASESIANPFDVKFPYLHYKLTILSFYLI